MEETKKDIISSVLNEEHSKEIIEKLIENEYLSNVINTMDGKGLVTLNKLDSEILEELHSLNDRVSLLDLKNALSIDQLIIEQRIKLFVEKDNTLYFNNGELFGPQFLINLIERINDILEQYGIVYITEISKNFSLTFDFAVELIEDHRDQINEAVIDVNDKGTIYTNEFIERQKRLVQGLLLAITRPIPLSTLSSHPTVNQKLFNRVLEALIREYKVSGFLKEKKLKNELGSPYFNTPEGVYVPEIYIRAQEAWIKLYYEQNGYIDFEAIKKLEVCEIKEFLTKKFPDALLLQSNAVNSKMLSQLNNQLETKLKENKFINIMNLVPNNFTSSDAIILLQNLPYFKLNSPILAPPHRLLPDVLSCPIILSDVYVTTTEFLHNFVEDMMPYIKNRAYNYIHYLLYTNSDKYSNLKIPKLEQEFYDKMESGDSYGLITLDELSLKVIELLRIKLNNANFFDNHLCTTISSILYRPINNKYRNMLLILNQKLIQDNNNIRILEKEIQYSHHLLTIYFESTRILKEELKLKNQNYLLSHFATNLVNNFQIYLYMMQDPISFSIKKHGDLWNIEEKIDIANDSTRISRMKKAESLDNLLINIKANSIDLKDFLENFQDFSSISFKINGLEKQSIILDKKRQLAENITKKKLIQLLIAKNFKEIIEFDDNEKDEYVELLIPYLNSFQLDLVNNFDPHYFDSMDHNKLNLLELKSELEFTV